MIFAVTADNDIFQLSSALSVQKQIDEFIILARTVSAVVEVCRYAAVYKEILR